MSDDLLMTLSTVVFAISSVVWTVVAIREARRGEMVSAAVDAVLAVATIGITLIYIHEMRSKPVVAPTASTAVVQTTGATR
jgi:hypothetical protein